MTFVLQEHSTSSTSSSQVVVALAQPGDVLPNVLEDLAGIVACALLAPFLLYVAARCAGLARSHGGLWWVAAPLALIASGAAMLAVDGLIRDFVDPGPLQLLAKITATAFVVIGIVLGCCSVYLLESQRLYRRFQFR